MSDLDIKEAARRIIDWQCDADGWSLDDLYPLARDVSLALLAMAEERERYRRALTQLAGNKLDDSNCASVELAGKRVRNIAGTALKDSSNG